MATASTMHPLQPLALSSHQQQTRLRDSELHQSQHLRMHLTKPLPLSTTLDNYLLHLAPGTHLF